MTSIQPAGDPSKWPTVIGVLCLIYAAIGFLANTCNGLWPWMQGPILSMAGLKDVAFPSGLGVMSMATGVVGFALAIVLVVAGLGVLRRRTNSFRLLRIWVIIKIAESVIGLGLGLMFMDAQVEYQTSIQDATRELILERGGDASAVPEKSADAIRRSSMMSLVFVGPLVLVFPVVIGLLATKKSWREDVDGWEDSVA